MVRGTWYPVYLSGGVFPCPSPCLCIHIYIRYSHIGLCPALPALVWCFGLLPPCILIYFALLLYYNTICIVITICRYTYLASTFWEERREACCNDCSMRICCKSNMDVMLDECVWGCACVCASGSTKVFEHHVHTGRLIATTAIRTSRAYRYLNWSCRRTGRPE